MSWRAVIADRAARDIAEQFHWLQRHSPGAANRWRASLLAAIDSLEDDPESYPEAAEAQWHDGLREFYLGKRRNLHRILFELQAPFVIILRVRHAAQDFLGPDDI
jgi:plasmid stabilization system protein ParE